MNAIIYDKKQEQLWYDNIIYIESTLTAVFSEYV